MANWPPLTLPEDAPLDEAGRQRYSEYRLDPVIGALHGMLNAWLATSGRGRFVPPRIGLFGGLGQGKSSVVRCVLEKLDGQRSWWQKAMAWVWGSRVARFDVSFFKADDLEWRFLTAVLWRRVRRNLLPGVLISAAVLGGVISLGVVSAWWNWQECSADWHLCGRWLLGVWAVLFLLPKLALPPIRRIGAIFGKVKGYDPAGGLYIARRDLLIQSFARFMHALPDVVVVDDLDRACVEQQRGFLRAIARFSQELGFAVVVCMDESELLFAPPNPEAPEELLRKTLTAELRVPDRSREDTALLAMSCVRELAKANPDHPLKPTLNSVSFVADLTRILLLDNAASPSSPRKVQRQLARVALHAGQLGVSGADDLAALLRIDGLLQLAPALRRRMDGLRQVLEANRSTGLLPLLVEVNLPEAHRPQVERFFNRTRMMQPALRDGWFRLLGGFAASDNEPRREECAPCSADWEIAARSHEFFRLFLEAIELDAAGYEHSLNLQVESVPSGGKGSELLWRYKFELPGGTDVSFALDELPPGFRELQADYFGQCWVLWVCALATAAASQKAALFERAYRWLNIRPQPDSALRNLFWRECLADAEFWDGLDENARSAWWSRAHGDASLRDQQGLPLLSIDRFFASSLRPGDFADAWAILVRPGNEVRDGRKALYWWRGLIPEILAGRELHATGAIDLLSKVWPAPVPEAQSAEGWSEVLMQHFGALNTVNAVKGQVPLAPAPLLYAWRRAQPFLDVGQCLDLLHSLAFDLNAPPGMRWSTRAVEPWLEVLEKRMVLDALKARAESSNIAERSDDRQTARQLFMLLLSGLRGWVPGDVASFVDGLPKDEMREIYQVLSDRGICPNWWPKDD